MNKPKTLGVLVERVAWDPPTFNAGVVWGGMPFLTGVEHGAPRRRPPSQSSKGASAVWATSPRSSFSTNQLAQGPPQPVEPRNHQDVPFSAPVEGLAQSASLGFPTADLLLEDPLAAVGEQRVALGFQLLLLPRHPRVPNLHCSIVPKTP